MTSLKHDHRQAQEELSRLRDSTNRLEKEAEGAKAEKYPPQKDWESYKAELIPSLAKLQQTELDRLVDAEKPTERPASWKPFTRNPKRRLSIMLRPSGWPPMSPSTPWFTATS
ncbi:MAG: hypothetical protein R2857_03445 [Vampirovibrionales bacterium]